MTAIRDTLQAKPGPGALNRSSPLHRLKRRILLADDDVAARRLIAALIRQLGFDVDTVANGEEALASVRAGGYDIVFLDIDMPMIDGVETALSIRLAKEVGETARIVAMSGFLDEFMEGRDCSDLFDATIAKPVTRFRLQDTIFNLLQTRRLPPQADPA